jgi:hypothetical protein
MKLNQSALYDFDPAGMSAKKLCSVKLQLNVLMFAAVKGSGGPTRP